MSDAGDIDSSRWSIAAIAEELRHLSQRAQSPDTSRDDTVQDLESVLQVTESFARRNKGSSIFTSRQLEALLSVSHFLAVRLHDAQANKREHGISAEPIERFRTLVTQLHSILRSANVKGPSATLSASEASITFTIDQIQSKLVTQAQYLRVLKFAFADVFRESMLYSQYLSNVDFRDLFGNAASIYEAHSKLVHACQPHAESRNVTAFVENYLRFLPDICREYYEHISRAGSRVHLLQRLSNESEDFKKRCLSIQETVASKESQRVYFQGKVDKIFWGNNFQLSNLLGIYNLQFLTRQKMLFLEELRHFADASLRPSIDRIVELLHGTLESANSSASGNRDAVMRGWLLNNRAIETLPHISHIDATRLAELATPRDTDEPPRLQIVNFRFDPRAGCFRWEIEGSAEVIRVVEAYGLRFGDVKCVVRCLHLPAGGSDSFVGAVAAGVAVGTVFAGIGGSVVGAAVTLLKEAWKAGAKAVTWDVGDVSWSRSFAVCRQYARSEVSDRVRNDNAKVGLHCAMGVGSNLYTADCSEVNLVAEVSLEVGGTNVPLRRLVSSAVHPCTPPPKLAVNASPQSADWYVLALSVRPSFPTLVAERLESSEVDLDAEGNDYTFKQAVSLAWNPEQHVPTIDSGALSGILQRREELALGRHSFSFKQPVSTIRSWQLIRRGPSHLLCKVPAFAVEGGCNTEVEVLLNGRRITDGIREMVDLDGNRFILVSGLSPSTSYSLGLRAQGAIKQSTPSFVCNHSGAHFSATLEQGSSQTKLVLDEDSYSYLQRLRGVLNPVQRGSFVQVMAPESQSWFKADKFATMQDSGWDVAAQSSSNPMDSIILPLEVDDEVPSAADGTSGENAPHLHLWRQAGLAARPSAGARCRIVPGIRGAATFATDEAQPREHVLSVPATRPFSWVTPVADMLVYFAVEDAAGAERFAARGKVASTLIVDGELILRCSTVEVYSPRGRWAPLNGGTETHIHPDSLGQKLPVWVATPPPASVRTCDAVVKDLVCTSDSSMILRWSKPEVLVDSSAAQLSPEEESYVNGYCVKVREASSSFFGSTSSVLVTEYTSSTKCVIRGLHSNTKYEVSVNCHSDISLANEDTSTSASHPSATPECEPIVVTTLSVDVQRSIDGIFHPDWGLSVMLDHLLIQSQHPNFDLVRGGVDAALANARLTFASDDGSKTVNVDILAYSEEDMMKDISVLHEDPGRLNKLVDCYKQTLLKLQMQMLSLQPQMSIAMQDSLWTSGMAQVPLWHDSHAVPAAGTDAPGAVLANVLHLVTRLRFLGIDAATHLIPADPKRAPHVLESLLAAERSMVSTASVVGVWEWHKCENLLTHGSHATADRADSADRADLSTQLAAIESTSHGQTFKLKDTVASVISSFEPSAADTNEVEASDAPLTPMPHTFDRVYYVVSNDAVAQQVAGVDSRVIVVDNGAVLKREGMFDEIFSDARAVRGGRFLLVFIVDFD